MCHFPLPRLDRDISSDHGPESLDEDALSDFQRCASAEDSNVLLRRHAAQRQRCAALVLRKPSSSFDFDDKLEEEEEEEEEEGGEDITYARNDKYHDAEFTPLSSAAASAAFTRCSTRTSSSAFTRSSTTASFTSSASSSFDMIRATSSTTAFGRLSTRPYRAPTIERAASLSPAAGQDAAEIGAFMLGAFRLDA